MEPYIMDLLDKPIRIHRRKRFVASEVAHWPAPMKHQLYRLDFERHNVALPQKVYLSAALDVVRQRPDINCLEISMHDLLDVTTSRALGDLLNMKDRDWSVCLCLVAEGAKFDQPRLRRALSVLQNVQHLSFIRNRRYGMDRDILDNLPPFHQLKCLNLRCWRMHPVDMVQLFDNYSFASRIQGICFSSKFPLKFTDPVLSGDIAPRIHTLDLCFSRFSVHDISLLLAGLGSLSSLETLRVNFFGVDDRYMEPLRPLFRWLESPQCPVKDLTFEQGSFDQLNMLVAILPRIPRLKAIRIPDGYGARILKHLFPVLLETPMLETIVLHVFKIDEESCNKIFSFQVNNRTRMFLVQLHFPPRQTQHAEAQKIHHVSLVHQTLRNFRNSKDHVAFPLSAWSIVLEKLGSAFDSSSVDVHAIGVDARFSIIQELLERPHVLLRRRE